MLFCSHHLSEPICLTIHLSKFLALRIERPVVQYRSALFLVEIYQTHKREERLNS